MVINHPEKPVWSRYWRTDLISLWTQESHWGISSKSWFMAAPSKQTPRALGEALKELLAQAVAVSPSPQTWDRFLPSFRWEISTEIKGAGSQVQELPLNTWIKAHLPCHSELLHTCKSVKNHVWGNSRCPSYHEQHTLIPLSVGSAKPLPHHWINILMAPDTKWESDTRQKWLSGWMIHFPSLKKAHSKSVWQDSHKICP